MVLLLYHGNLICKIVIMKLQWGRHLHYLEPIVSLRWAKSYGFAVKSLYILNGSCSNFEYLKLYFSAKFEKSDLKNKNFLYLPVNKN